MVEPRVFLFLGGDEPEKQKKIQVLKKKTLPPQLTDLNYCVVYADEKGLTPVILQETLDCLPTEGAKYRLVVVKIGSKMNRGIQECLLKEAADKESRTMLVVDVPKAEDAEAFVAALTKTGAEVVRFRSEAGINPFDLGRAVVARQPARALEVLKSLIEGRHKPEKIMGALFWQWERSHSERRLTDEVYAKGLKLLAETDRRLKTSSVAHRQEGEILEVLVVRLSYLP